MEEWLYMCEHGVSFPLNKPKLLALWLAQMRLETPPLKEYHRMCLEHFTDLKYIEMDIIYLLITKSL